MIRNFFACFSDDVAIDMGTSNTLVLSHGDVLVNEPSVIAVRQEASGGKRLAAAGMEAKRMIGKESRNIKAIMPVREGVVVDFEMASLMLKHYLGRTRTRRFGKNRRIMVTAPTAITPVESKSLINLIESVGAGEVRLIEEPIAAALGSGIRINEPEGSLIVDIGGGITETAVLSLSGIVCSKTIPVAGNHMDAAIVQYMKKNYSLLIGDKLGEEIKTTIGCAFFDGKGNTVVTVKGMDPISGIPSYREVNGEEFRFAMMPQIEHIVDAIKEVLGQCPPELSADIVNRGIVLTGGCALLANIHNILSDKIGLPITVSKDPLLAVARGAGMALGGL